MEKRNLIKYFYLKNEIKYIVYIHLRNKAWTHNTECYPHKRYTEILDSSMGAMLKAILLDSVNCPSCVCTNHNDVEKYSTSNFKWIGHKEIPTLMLGP